MQKIKGYTSGQRTHFIYVFLFGFFIGVFLMNLWKSTLLSEAGFLDEEMLYQMKYTRIEEEPFFFYVLRKRLAAFFVPAIFATTCLGTAVTYGAFIWFGFAGGSFMAVVCIRYGLKGILLLCAAFFPQHLFYIPAFWLLLNGCYQICCILYFPAKAYGDWENHYRSRKAFLAARGIYLLMLLVVVITGIFLESYVNPTILTKLLNIF